MNWQPTAVPAEAGRGRGRRWLAGGALALALIASGPSAAAQEPWGFEQVTPVEKGSGAVSTNEFFQASPDGQRLLHSSVLPYEPLGVVSAPVLSKYVATRGPDAWGNAVVDVPYAPPQDPVISQSFFHGTVASSRNLDWAVVVSRVPLTPDANPEGGSAYLKNTRTGELRLIYTTDAEGWRIWESGQNFTSGLHWRYVADDGKSVIFSAYQQLGPLTEDAPASGPGLYSWTEEAGLRYEAKVDGESVNSANSPGADQSGPRDTMPSGDRGVDHVYFQADGNSGPTYVSEGPADARASRLVSYSRLVAPPEPPAGPTPTPAEPIAAGEGGRFALIQTRNNVPLVGGEPTGLPSSVRYLYRFDAEASDPADELQYVGAVPGTGSAGRLVQMSQDGATVVFYSSIAQGGSPADTQRKLFVWREGHGLTYLYTADAGSTGTNNTEQLRRLSDNGRYLSFSDNSVSLAAQFGMADNVSAGCPNVLQLPGPCDQTYRYDIETGDFDCVSCRTDGGAPLGHSGRGSGSIFLNRYQVRTVADDGSVFFTSRDGLVDEDRNALDDVYAWHHDSGLRLVSPATPGQQARFIDASADGKVVFIASRERLAASDKDSEEDVYATFAGAGFAAAADSGSVAECVGGDCRDPFVAPGGPLIASEGYAGNGNVKAAARVSLAVKAPKAVAGRVAVLRVRVPTAGRVAVSGGRVRNSRRAVGRARTVRVRAVLTPRARRALAKRTRIAVRVRVAFSPRAGRAMARTVRVVFTKPDAKRAASVTKGGR